MADLSISPEGTPRPEAVKTAIMGLQVPDRDYVLYGNRWHMLLIYCIATIIINAVGYTFSPIPDYSNAFFGNIGSFPTLLLTSFSFLMYPIGTIFEQYIGAKFGVRFLFNLGMFVLVLLTGLRVLACLVVYPGNSPVTGYVLMILGQTISGFNAPFFINLPVKIAGYWFGLRERDLASAIGAMSIPLGVAVQQVFSASIVQNYDKSGLRNITLVVFIQFILSLGCAIWVYLCFQEFPPTPPSRSAEEALKAIFEPTQSPDSPIEGIQIAVRKYKSLPEVVAKMKSDMYQVMTKKSFILLLIAFTGGFGFINAFAAIIPQLVAPYGFTYTESALLAAVMIVFGILGSLLSGMILDRTHAYVFLLRAHFWGSFLSGLCLFIALAARSFIGVLVVTICFGMSVVPILPITLANAAEALYPIDENTSAGILLTVGNIYCLFSISIFQVVVEQDANDPIGEGHPINLSTIFIISYGAVLLILALFYNGDRKRYEMDADPGESEQRLRKTTMDAASKEEEAAGTT